MESLEVKRYYEWLSTSRQGKVEVYVAEDDTQVYFESGRFIPKEQLDVLLRQVDESVYSAKGGDSQFSPPPPPQQPQSLDEWEKLLGNPQPNSIAPPTPPQQTEKSAVQIILEKQKKFTDVFLDVKIPFQFPSEKAIEFMTLMFDEDEVMDEVSNFVYSQMTSDEINLMIKSAIKEKLSSIIDNKVE